MFAQVAGNARLNRRTQHGFLLVAGQDHHLRSRPLLLDRHGRLDSRAVGHVNVQQDDVGLQRTRGIDRLSHGAPLPHHLDVGLSAENRR